MIHLVNNKNGRRVGLFCANAKSNAVVTSDYFGKILEKCHVPHGWGKSRFGGNCDAGITTIGVLPDNFETSGRTIYVNSHIDYRCERSGHAICVQYDRKEYLNKAAQQPDYIDKGMRGLLQQVFGCETLTRIIGEVDEGRRFEKPTLVKDADTRSTMFNPKYTIEKDDDTL